MKKVGYAVVWLAIAAWVIFLAAVVRQDAEAKGACLTHGYVDMSRSGWSERFCVKREYGSDVVVSLRSLKGAR